MIHKRRLHNSYINFVGNWSPWGPLGQCSTTCGDGIREKYRTCDNPAPRPEGSNCQGQPSDSQPCNLKECPGS